MPLDVFALNSPLPCGKAAFVEKESADHAFSQGAAAGAKRQKISPDMIFLLTIMAVLCIINLDLI